MTVRDERREEKKKSPQCTVIFETTTSSIANKKKKKRTIYKQSYLQNDIHLFDIKSPCASITFYMLPNFCGKRE